MMYFIFYPSGRLPIALANSAAAEAVFVSSSSLDSFAQLCWQTAARAPYLEVWQ